MYSFKISCGNCDAHMGTLVFNNVHIESNVSRVDINESIEVLCELCSHNPEESFRHLVRGEMNKRIRLHKYMTSVFNQSIGPAGESSSVIAGRAGHPLLLKAGTHSELLLGFSEIEINYLRRAGSGIVNKNRSAIETELQCDMSTAFIRWLYLVQEIECGKMNTTYVRLVLSSALPKLPDLNQLKKMKGLRGRGKRIDFLNSYQNKIKKVGTELSKRLTRSKQLQRTDRSAVRVSLMEGEDSDG
ncbi:hypothetical protein [Aliikangiella coralliicola]|uniref:Uncharacterized protein n=1 Tax=Aliikangiella coralliicola TaxID=2592383 RepID=A0A545U4Q8_9GAMM|nr:hypothetical protein [Aliikangiella coralliicola]TQV84393.1 hypothetical protein FLL46_22485 [Aliikangiella coralliicola]